MTNYTTEKYQMKRESFNFSNKLSNGCSKTIIKFCNDMIYGIMSRKSVLLTELARGLKEKSPIGLYSKIYSTVSDDFKSENEVYLVSVHGLTDDIDSDNEKYGDDNVIMFLTNMKINNKKSAERIVRIYFLRWRIEEYFKSKKQNYKWESSIVRTLDENE